MAAPIRSTGRLRDEGDLAPDAASTPGRLDAATADALRRFQVRHGLDADGTLGAATLAALRVPPAARSAARRCSWTRSRRSR